MGIILLTFIGVTCIFFVLAESHFFTTYFAWEYFFGTDNLAKDIRLPARVVAIIIYIIPLLALVKTTEKKEI
jgi:hypothetical protein